MTGENYQNYESKDSSRDEESTKLENDDTPKIQLSNVMSIALFQKPYDRKFIIYMENVLVNFIESMAQSMELNSMNSYYRLLSYQIADYHNLKHSLININNSIIVYKSDDAVLPNDRILLQCLQPFMIMIEESQRIKPKYNKYSDPNEFHENEQTPNGFESVNNSGTNLPAKKFKILKKIHADVENSDKLNCPLDIQGESMSDSISASRSESAPKDIELEKLRKEELYELRKKEIFEDNDNGNEIDNEINEDTEKDINDDNNRPSSDTKLVTTPERKSRNSQPFLMEDGSPQPRQFETSRYQINKQQQCEYKQTKQQHSYYSQNNQSWQKLNRKSSKFNGKNYNTKHSHSNGFDLNQIPYGQYPNSYAYNVPQLGYPMGPMMSLNPSMPGHPVMKRGEIAQPPYMVMYPPIPSTNMHPNFGNNVPIPAHNIVGFNPYYQQYTTFYNGYYNHVPPNNMTSQRNTGHNYFRDNNPRNDLFNGSNERISHSSNDKKIIPSDLKSDLSNEDHEIGTEIDVDEVGDALEKLAIV